MGGGVRFLLKKSALFSFLSFCDDFSGFRLFLRKTSFTPCSFFPLFR